MTLKAVPPHIDAAAVLALLADIDGDGSLTLDPDGLKGRGFPDALITPLVRSIRAGDPMLFLFEKPAGDEARIRCVHCLELLNALLQHYGLSNESPYMGRSSDARLYSARIRQHLGAATDKDLREIAEVERRAR